MTLTVSVVLLAGLLLALLLKHKALGAGAATVAALFGFYLANTGAADTVNQLITALADALGSLG
jgi:hypothetical protein